MEALRLFCADRGLRLRLKVYAFSCEGDEPAFQGAATPAQIVRDDHFQQSDLIVYEFGLEFNLYESIHPRLARCVFPGLPLRHHPPPSGAGREPPPTASLLCPDAQPFAADEVFVTSRYVGEELRRIGLPPSKVRLLGLPAGVAVEAAPAENHRRRRDDFHRPLRGALYVGRFVPAKRVGDLIEALALHRRSTPVSAPIEAMLLGSLIFSDCAYVDELRAMADTLGVSDAITWLFDVPAATLSDAYHNADVLVVPSSHEGFCVPVIEAYQHGCGVIGSNATALPETIGGLGLTFACGDPDALTDALAHYRAAWVEGRVATDTGIHDRDEWQTLVTAHLDQFRLDRFQAAMAEVYERNLVEPVEPARAPTHGPGASRPARSAPRSGPFAPRLAPRRSASTALRPDRRRPGARLRRRAAPTRGRSPDPTRALRRRLAWIRFKRAVKQVPVAAPVAVWGKRRVVAVLRYRVPILNRLKRGLRRVPFLGLRHPARQAGPAHATRHPPPPARALRGPPPDRGDRPQGRVARPRHARGLCLAGRARVRSRRLPAHELGHGRPTPVYLPNAAATPPPTNDAPESTWLNIHPATYDGRLRVVVGCGDQPWPDHINVDHTEDSRPDVVAVPAALPFPPGSIRELAIQRLDPTTTRHAFESSLLSHWSALLAPHSTLRLIARDPQAWLERVPLAVETATTTAPPPSPTTRTGPTRSHPPT